MDKITDVEYNLNQNIKDIIGNTLMEQTMNITIVTIITVISIIIINIYLLLNIITEKIIKKINTDIIDKKVLEVTEKINHRLLVIEKDMKNSIITKLDQISNVQQIQATDVKQVLDGLFVEQSDHITRQVNNKIISALNDENIHEFSENTNRRLVTIENKLEILGTNRNKDMNELFDKIKLCIVNNMNKNQETDNINNDKEKNMIKSIEDIINTRLTDMKKDIQNSFIQHMKETTEKINKRTGLFTKNTNISVMKEQSTDASLNKTQPQQLNDQWNDLISSICSLTIPSSVLVRSSIWKEKKTPEEDELDKYMVSKTGCGYVACVRGDALYRLPDTKLLGARLQWRGAVRGGEDAFIRVEWRPNAHGYDTVGYSIYIGEKLNTVTRVVDSRTYYSLQELHTPRLLSRDRYVWFHLTLEPGRFTFRTTCDEKLAFTHAADIKKGETVRMSFDSNSTYGTKFLYDCLMDVE